MFIAINFNQATRARLLALRDELQSQSKRGRFSAPENLHLTLVFLGECDAKQADAAKAAMGAAAFAPLYVSIDRVGRFRRDGCDIWWAGIRADKPLLDLQSSLTEMLAEAGFSTEKRKYSPHITLGREVVTGAEPRQIEAFGETARRIELMKSERINSKLTYTKIYECGC